MKQQGEAGRTLSAKTQRTGSLHLPNEIRNRIYEEVIWDHDRAAVYLPRKLPRKVNHDGWKITENFMDLINRNDPREGIESITHEVMFDYEEINFGNQHHDCRWSVEQRPAEEIPLPVFTEEETDDETDIDLRVCPPSPAYWSLPESDRHHHSHMSTRELAASKEQDLEGPDLCEGCKIVYCVCTKSDSSDEDEETELDDANHENSNPENESDEDDEHEKWDEEGTSSRLNGASQAIRNGKPTQSATTAAASASGSDQDEEAYVDSDSDNDDDPLEEDDEHFDSEERMGMLFRTEEPPILLACKEIREQCLSLYYGANSFTWRFFWLDQERSLDRFEQWTKVVGEHARHITQISFEGRHSVEEGIEFEVDIDLLDDAPYFDLAVDCIHPGDELTDVIEGGDRAGFHYSALEVVEAEARSDQALVNGPISARNSVLGSIAELRIRVSLKRGQWDGKLTLGPR